MADLGWSIKTTATYHWGSPTFRHSQVDILDDRTYPLQSRLPLMFDLGILVVRYKIQSGSDTKLRIVSLCLPSTPERTLT